MFSRDKKGRLFNVLRSCHAMHLLGIVQRQTDVQKIFLKKDRFSSCSFFYVSITDKTKRLTFVPGSNQLRKRTKFSSFDKTQIFVCFFKFAFFSKCPNKKIRKVLKMLLDHLQKIHDTKLWRFFSRYSRKLGKSKDLSNRYKFPNIDILSN